MLRDEDNAGYRSGLKACWNTVAILERYVNFMNNLDEETVEQFGKGDKYFGIATMMATLPACPCSATVKSRFLGEVRDGIHLSLS